MWQNTSFKSIYIIFGGNIHKYSVCTPCDVAQYFLSVYVHIQCGYTAYVHKTLWLNTILPILPIPILFYPSLPILPILPILLIHITHIGGFPCYSPLPLAKTGPKIFWHY